jgi:hypothetical protein
MGLKKFLGAVSPIYGAVTGEGIMGKITRHGALGELSNAYRDDKARQEQREIDDAEKKKQMYVRQNIQNVNAGATAGTTAPTMKRGGAVKTAKPAMKARKNGAASSTAKRGDGIARQGRTRGRFV